MGSHHASVELLSATRRLIIVTCASLGVTLTSARADESQAAVAAPVGTVVKRVHAVGAQVYECKADGHGGLAWTFREPIATLISDGTTVGRHFAGPAWEWVDGSRVVARVAAKAPGTSSTDIPWLKLDVSQHQGSGLLDGVTTVQRIATVGGNKTGSCQTEGALVAEPYAADYVFARP